MANTSSLINYFFIPRILLIKRIKNRVIILVNISLYLDNKWVALHFLQALLHFFSLQLETKEAVFFGVPLDDPF